MNQETADLIKLLRDLADRLAASDAIASPTALQERRGTLTTKEAAEMLGVSLSMVYKLHKAGHLEGYTVGARRIVYKDSIDAYRHRHTIRPVEPKPVEPKPVEPKPVEPKPAETVPVPRPKTRRSPFPFPRKQLDL
jgi:excisionase family DNA binding protein